MTAEEVLRLHTQGLIRALQEHDYAALESIYSDRFMLVRPDGSLLNKEQALKDLREHKVAFHPIALKDVAVQVLGPTAILTAETTTLSSRDGKHIYTHYRFVAVYAQEAGAIRLVHFQGTALSDGMSTAKEE